MQHSLQKKLIGPQAQRELLAFLGNHLPHFNTPASTAPWLIKAQTLRGEMLALVGASGSGTSPLLSILAGLREGMGWGGGGRSP